MYPPLGANGNQSLSGLAFGVERGLLIPQPQWLQMFGMPYYMVYVNQL